MQKVKKTITNIITLCAMIVSLLVTSSVSSISGESGKQNFEKGEKEYWNQDYRAAEKSFLAAFEMGYYPAANRLGDIYFEGTIRKQDYKKSLNWYLKAARNNDSRAMFNIAKLFDAAVFSEDIGALLNVVSSSAGQQFDNPEDVQLFYLRKSAEAGLPIAQLTLCTSQEFESPAFKISEPEVWNWCELAIEAEDSSLSGPAALILAERSEKGIGREVNLTEALTYYKKAAGLERADVGIVRVEALLLALSNQSALAPSASKPSSQIEAKTQEYEQKATSALPGRRVALVVGINDYESLPKLQKAVNDSRAVSRALTSIGYDVVSVENPDRRTLSKKLSELQSKIQPGDNALFYFAGHGVALGAENILIAKDMPRPASGDEDLVRDEGFSVDDIVRRIQKQGAKTAFLVLDACRDNPFDAGGTRSIGGTRGLEKTDAPSGVFVLFSAGIGQAALDRLGDNDNDPNSVFTRKLLPVLGTKGLTLTGVAKSVQKEVAELAATINHAQQPAYYDQIIGDVVINPQ